MKSLIRMSTEIKMVPPDGGWGWIVCFAYAMNNVIVLPLISGFGLIFQARFKEIGMSATETSIIMIVNYAFGMLLSLFNGPLLKNFGYRKIAVLGSVVVAFGVMTTSCANSFVTYLLTYSIITSVGVALVMAAFTLAINSYFNKNRGKAVGLGMSITGLGPILMPQFMYLLIQGYGIRGAVLILGALSLHSFAAALLLRPIKWYLKPADAGAELNNLNPKDENEPVEDINLTESQATTEKPQALLAEARKSMEDVSENEKTYKLSSLSQQGSRTSLQMRDAIANPETASKARVEPISDMEKWWGSRDDHVSTEVVPKNHIRHTIQQNGDIPKEEYEIKTLLEDHSNKLNSAVYNDLAEPLPKNRTLWMKIVDFFDLSLMKDPIFVNILVGISIAGSAEINFTLLTPFILNDLKFEIHQIAAFMSVVAFADILFRFISPFIGDWCRKPPRTMYLGSLILLIFTRSTLFIASSYSALLVVALILGIAKGVRTVYMNLVIPSYVPIERLPFASGIQMPINGVILLTFGPLLGLIRDKSGSYTVAIICINVVTLITIILWSSEFLYFKMTEKRKLLQDGHM